MGLTAFPGGISSFGIPAGVGPVWPIGGAGLASGPGKAFFIDTANGLDSNTGLSPDKPMAKLSAVHAKMTANQNDTVYIIGNSSASAANVVSETATLTWSKDLCHIVGVNSFNRVSQRVSLRPTTNDYTPFMTISADGCVFANFHIFDNGSSTSQITVNHTGQRNYFDNCHIFGMANDTAAGGSGSRSILITGGDSGENLFKNCVLGGDTIARGAANATLELASGTTRNIFENCYFISWSDATSPVHVDADAANALGRFAIFKDCTFLNFGTTILECFNIHATVNGTFIIQNSYSQGATDWENSISGNLYLEGDQTNNATVGLMEIPT